MSCQFLTKSAMWIAVVAIIAFALQGCGDDANQKSSNADTASPLPDFSVHLVSMERTDGALLQAKGQSGEDIWILPDPLITDADVATTHKSATNQGEPSLTIELTDVAARRVVENSDNYVGGYLAFMWQGELVFLPGIGNTLGKQLMMWPDGDTLTAAHIEAIAARLSPPLVDGGMQGQNRN